MHQKFIDDLGNEIHINFLPKKIVSLVPSITELLFDLGLNKEVVGITKFCERPNHWFKNKTRVGGTKTINIDKINAFNPDLIIANKEENDQKAIEQLQQKNPVWICDVKTWDDGLNMILKIGELTNTTPKANEIVTNIKTNFEQLKTQAKTAATYLVWKEPLMVAGGDTFIDSMMQKAGFENIFESQNRYPQISLKQLQQKAPQFILLPSEPFPFKQKHLIELQKQLPNSKCVLVDGQMFSWYGSRMLHFTKYINDLTTSLHKIDK